MAKRTPTPMTLQSFDVTMKPLFGVALDFNVLATDMNLLPLSGRSLYTQTWRLHKRSAH